MFHILLFEITNVGIIHREYLVLGCINSNLRINWRFHNEIFYKLNIFDYFESNFFRKNRYTLIKKES